MICNFEQLVCLSAHSDNVLTVGL